ncbi:MAG: tail fiber domain-containing protein [Ferruginibacter sp.]
MKRIFITAALMAGSFFLQAQNVGIGTNTPRSPLSFPPTLGQKIALWDDGNAGGANYGIGVQGGLLQVYAYTSLDNIGFGYGSSGSFTETMRILGNGNIGIGTALPAAYGHGGTNRILQVHNLGTASNSQSHLILSTNASSTSYGSIGGITMVAPNTTFSEKRMAYIGSTFSATGGDLRFYTNNSNVLSQQMTILSNGKVGIGSTNPLQPLVVAGTASDIATFDGGNQMYITLSENGAAKGYIGSFLQPNTADDIDFGTHTNNTTGSLHLTTLGTARLTVSSAGNIGIGNTNPARPLSFPAALGEKIVLYPGAVGEVGLGVYGGELRLHCDIPGGKVSFGTQDNAGNFTEAAKAQINGAYAFSIFGSLWANGTTYASDERFKQNITSITAPLQKLLQINGVEYEMKTTAFEKNHFQPGRQIGLLAQNVEKIIPEAVNELDGYKGVDYARLVPLLIESVKEQQQQIETLKKELAQLKSSPSKK